MSEATTPAAGHNSGGLDLSLALDADQLLKDLQGDTEPLFRRKEELLDAFERFETATKDGIKTEEVQAKAGDFIRQIKAYIDVVDARRTVIKKPVLDAQRQIDGFFKRDIIDPLEAARTQVLRKVEAFLRVQREEEQRRAQAEAQRQREEAARLAAEAERTASPETMDRAMDAEAAAETIASAAPVARMVRSDLGTTVSQRRGPWKVRVVDINQVPRQYLVVNEPVLLATAKTDSRVEAGEQPIPGVEFYREIKASIR